MLSLTCNCFSLSDVSWYAQRRLYAVVEMSFMLYRCLLPVPVWLEFYGKEGDYFAALYLVLKVRCANVEPFVGFCSRALLERKVRLTVDILEIGVVSQLASSVHMTTSIMVHLRAVFVIPAQRSNTTRAAPKRDHEPLAPPPSLFSSVSIVAQRAWKFLFGQIGS